MFKPIISEISPMTFSGQDLPSMSPMSSIPSMSSMSSISSTSPNQMFNLTGPGYDKTQGRHSLDSFFERELALRNLRFNGLRRATKEKYINYVNSSIDKITKAFRDVMNDGDPLVLERLVSKYPNHIDYMGLTPLKIAVGLENIESVLVIATNSKYTVDKDILPYAATFNNMGILKELINEDIDLNAKDCEGETALIIAVRNNNTKLVELLLSREGIDVNCKDNDGKTPLVDSIINRKKDIIFMLLNNDDIKMESDVHEKKNILELLSNFADKEIIIKILDSDLNFSVDDLNDFFMSSLRKNKVDIELFQKFMTFVDINNQDVYGNTPLIYSCTNGQSCFTKILLEHGADMSKINKMKMNALMCAIKSHNLDCIKILFMYLSELEPEIQGQIVNNVNIDNDNPLLLAIKNHDDYTIKKLCAMSVVDFNTQDSEGRTPLLLSITKNSLAAFNGLIKNENVDVNLEDYEGNFPIIYAMRDAGNRFNSTTVVDLSNHLVTSNYTYYCLELLRHPKLDINKKNLLGQTPLILSILKKFGKWSDSGTSISDAFLSDEMSIFPQCFSYCLNFQDNICSNPDEWNNFIVNTLLERPDIDINVYDNTGRSPLIYACENQDILLFNKLLQYDSLEINAPNKEGKTVLIHVVENMMSDNKECALESYSPSHFNSKSSLESSLKPTNLYGTVIKDIPRGPLQLDDSYNSRDVYKNYSISKPTLIKKETSNSNTSHFFFLKRLIQHPKIDINFQDFEGNTALIYACTSEVAVIKTILDHKDINVDLPNYRGETPLMRAVNNNLWNLVKLLLKAGADINHKSNSGVFIKTLAEENGTSHILSTITEQYKTTKGWFF